MTYMHFDVFPAESLGWLCRALNTRDSVCMFTFPGNHLRRCTPAVPPYAWSNLPARVRFKEGNQSQRSWVGRRGVRGRRRTKRNELCYSNSSSMIVGEKIRLQNSNYAPISVGTAHISPRYRVYITRCIPSLILHAFLSAFGGYSRWETRRLRLQS